MVIGSTVIALTKLLPPLASRSASDHEFGSRADAELLENRVQMKFDGAFAQA
jgi:hypothetical protein